MSDDSHVMERLSHRSYFAALPSKLNAEVAQMDNSNRVPITEIPIHLQKSLERIFLPYSVAIARVRDNKASTFSPLGSGTLVSRNDRHGILTAHHCLHQATPEVRLGAVGGDTLFLILREGRTIVVEPLDVIERALATPNCSEYGPDLTFIEIVNPSRLSSFQAIGSFWNLSQNWQDLEAIFSDSGTPLAAVGFPEEDYRTMKSRSDIHHEVRHMVFLNSVDRDAVSTRDKWDYLDLTCRYSGNNLPETFAGVSGGAVWAYQHLVSRSTGDQSLGKFALVGVQFYETPKEGDLRHVRAHFIRSIYDVAWRIADGGTR